MPSELHQIEATDPVEARRAIKALVEASGLSMLQIEELAGLPKGYLPKILGEPPIRGLSAVAIFSVLGVVAHKVVFVPDERAARRIKAHSGYEVFDKRYRHYGAKHWRNTKALLLVSQWGRQGALKMLANYTKEGLSEIRSRGAKKRWKKFRRERAQAQRAARNPRIRRNTTLASGSLGSAPR